jgi:rubrerythrin
MIVSKQVKTKPAEKPALLRAPPEHDLDWEYTGAEHRCPECGYRFEDTREDLDFCPDCGVSVQFEEE